MPAIEGKLECVEILHGRFPLKDLKIVVGGIKFYKTNWDLGPGETKEDYIKPFLNRLGEKVEIEYEKKNTFWAHFLLDRINKIKIPKKYNEISRLK